MKAVVIVGGGQAGYQTAASLRQEGYGGDITIIGEEPGLPYLRPPLSKAYLLGKTDSAGLAFRPAAFYADNGIDLVAARATAIDRINRRVETADAGAYAYDHLVLATGAHNRALHVPGADLDGVYGLRNLADADVLKQRLDRAADVVVVGAGFIGLEFAAVARSRGATVHVLDLADRPMARALSPEMSRIFADGHRASGTTLHFREGLSQIEGRDGAVTGVVLTNGRWLAADIVVVGIGVIPNTILAAEAGLDLDNGIRVDAHLLTSDPAISAIGDCASFPSQRSGGQLRLESVQNAADQARTVAARIAGKPAVYDAVPWFWTDQGDFKLQMVGLATDYDATVVLGDPDSRTCTVLMFRRGQLIAVECLNRPGDFMVARKLMARHPALRPGEAAAPGFDLRAWSAANA